MIDPHIQALLEAMTEGGFQLPDPLDAESLGTPILFDPNMKRPGMTALRLRCKMRGGSWTSSRRRQTAVDWQYVTSRLHPYSFLQRSPN